MPGESKSSPREIQNYLGRISGPLLDRIDLHVEVPAVKFREISGDRTGETSAEIRERVVAARKRQHVRFKDKPKITWNARMRAFEIYTTHHSYRRHQKDKVFFHHKPFPLEIKTLGDLLMVRRKQAGFTHKQLAAKTGVRLHWIRRFEFDRCLPPQPEWDSLRKFLKLPPTPILTLHNPKRRFTGQKALENTYGNVGWN